MKCPHCHKEGKHIVRETRSDGDAAYRRRQCAFCLRGFVTIETVSSAKMPTHLRNSYARRGENDKQPEAGAPTFQTDHLQRLLSGR